MIASGQVSEVAAWLQQNVMPIERLTIGQGNADLMPLADALRNVRVVGIGEATHGTREFVQLRNRLLHFLAAELGFNVLAIEGSYSAAHRVNDYVLHGTGDPAAALSGLGFVMWDIEEVADVVDSLRVHNQSAHAAARIRFHGLDIWNTRGERDRVLEYVRAMVPDEAPWTEALFRQVAASEAKGMMVAHQHVSSSLLMQLLRLWDLVESPGHRGVRQTEDHEQIQRHLRIVIRWVTANLTEQVANDLPPGVPQMAGFNNYARSRYLAEHAIELMEREPDAKIVIWAHNFHVAVGFDDPVHGVTPNMGAYLRARLGQRYYAMGLELNHGAYLARRCLADQTLGDFQVGTIPPAPEGTVGWYLGRLGRPNLFLELRAAAAPRRVREWLLTPGIMHTVSWVYTDPPRLYTAMAPAQRYDGVLFIDSTSPTTPTRNAVKAVADRTSY